MKGEQVVSVQQSNQIIKTFTLKEEHVAMIDELCQIEQRSASAIIRKAIENYYKEMKQ